MDLCKLDKFGQIWICIAEITYSTYTIIHGRNIHISFIERLCKKLGHKEAIVSFFYIFYLYTYKHQLQKSFNKLFLILYAIWIVFLL